MDDDKVKDPTDDASNILFLTITENLNLHQVIRGWGIHVSIPTTETYIHTPWKQKKTHQVMME
jgi:hypothetical protein